jgi:hypothetical protein
MSQNDLPEPELEVRRPRLTRRRLLIGATVILAVGVLGGSIVVVKAFTATPHGRLADSSASTDPTAAQPADAGPSGAGRLGAAPSASKAVTGPAAHGGSGAKLREVDGGTGFYGKFSSPLPSDPSFFPVAVWLESVTEQADTAKDKDVGLNTYLELTTNSTPSLIRDAGMYAIPSGRTGVGTETVGWFLSDETDMWAGSGNAPWGGKYPGEGDICQPASDRCGYTVQQTVRKGLPNDGRLRYSNYGKGVTFWETDAEASRFVNEFQNVLSADNYWFTDDNICGENEGASLYDHPTLVAGPPGEPKRLPPDMCHLAANYGKTIDRLRSLVKPAGSKPVWGFVELGHPASEDSAPTIKPPQIAGAVWSSLIHGARGIVYFNHSFGGPCQTQHALRDPCYKDVRATVADLNGKIKALAPVLNAPFADGVVKATGVDFLTKWYDGHFYVLAGANRPSAQTATFTLTCVGDATATAVNENRTLPVAKGTFTDKFADGNAVHIYRIDGGSSCGAY